MNQKKADSSQLSSLSRSALHASVFGQGGVQGSASGDSFRFFENFLYPFIAETNRTMPESAVLNIVMSIIFIAQIFFGCCFDFANKNVNPIVEIIDKILFLSLTSDQNVRLSSYIIITSFDAAYAVLFIFTFVNFKMTYEFSKTSRFILKYILGNLSCYTVIVNPMYFFAAVASLGVQVSALTIAVLILSIIFNITSFMIYEYLSLPIYYSPYISRSSFFLWNPKKMIHNMYIFGLAFGMSHFFSYYANWYQIIPPLVSIYGSFFFITYGWQLQPKNNVYCSLFIGCACGFIISSILSIINLFVQFPDLVRYIVPLSVMVVTSLIVSPFVLRKRKAIINALSCEAILRENLKTEEEKAEYFSTMGITTTDMAFTYLIIGMEEACPLFLDFSFTRFLINKFPEDNQLLVIQTWFASFFPNEQMTMHSLITLVNRMIQPTHLLKVIRFQLHRVHIFRQSSASKEANSDLNRVKQLTDSVIAENCKFWSNASLPHTEVKEDFHRKLSLIRQKGEAGWAEAIDKYPNNSRFANEYSRFLIEGVCEFKEGLKWYRRAIKIDSGQHKETDQLFKTFVASFPFYLKQGIVNFNGDIKMKKVMKEEDGTSTSSSSSSKGFSLTDQSSNDDSDSTAFDLQECEKSLPQAPLRLAFESAVKAMKPRVISSSIISSTVRLIVSIVFCGIVFFVLNPIFNDSQITFNHLSEISKVEHLFNVVGDQSFWYLASSMKAFSPSIESYFGPNLWKTHTYTNLKSPSMAATVGNMSSILNQRIDQLSRNLYLTELSTQDEFELVELLTETPINHSICDDLGSGFEPVESSNTITIDGLLRSYLIRASKLASITNSTNPPESAKILFNSRTLCEFYVYYSKIHDLFNSFAMNRSIVYYQEITHYLNSDSPTSIYMGDAETNFEEGEFEEIEKVMSSAQSMTDIFIAFTPFVILLFSMPSVIFLSAVLKNEIKAFSSMLLSMSPEACQEASEKIQKNLVSNGKGSFVGVTQSGAAFPYYVINLINAFVLIGIIIALSLYTQSVSSQTATYIAQYNLFMQLRNAYMQIGYLTQYLVLSNLIDTDQTRMPFTIKTPYISTSEIKLMISALNTETSMIQGIIDIGNDDHISALGINEKIDNARFVPLCEQETDTQYSLDFYRCLSFDRLCAFFTARAKELRSGIATLSLESEELYNFAFIINSRLMTGFDTLFDTYEEVFAGTISTFQTIVLLLFVAGLVFSVVSFIIEIGVLSAIKDMFKTLNIIMLRINPIHFVQNQAATAFLIGKDNANDAQITSAAHAVFHTSTDAMILLNNDCIIEKLNPAATSIFHFTPEQMLGQQSTLIIPKDNQKNSQLYYTMQLMGSGQCGLVYEAQLEGVRDDGVKVPIKATMIGFSNNQKNAEIFAIMCKDQTEEMKQKEAVEIAKKQSDELLLKILPPDIIRRINRGEKDITMVVNSASVIFIDICQFSSYMATLSASQLMCNLNAVFTAYDKIVADLPLITKIKLIGDDYMAAAGLFSPDEPPKMHAIQTITFGLRVLEAIEDLNEQLNASLMVRIGVNSGGPIIAGVLGTEKPLFDIIGDAINVAARLQSTDVPGFVQISKATYELVAAEGRFHIEERGEIFLKGKGNQTTYLVSNEPDAFRIKERN